MKQRLMLLWLSVLIFNVVAGQCVADESATLRQRNETLIRRIQSVHSLTEDQTDALRKIFAKSGYIGQGNPAVTKHPVTVEECEAKCKSLGVNYEDPTFLEICGSEFMAPLYNPAFQKPEDARVCIDQFEFPDIPCAYPVVWVKAREAAEICEAMGKRLCDAHEWEGACAGSLEEPDYRFDLSANRSPEEAIRLMRNAHNKKYGDSKSWSYGPQYRTGICGASSHKSPGCGGGSWSQCGSNTFPAGYFPDCHSPLMVYDLNGNAAEHMNLPLNESQMASRGSHEYGYTEMKGSWFIFDGYRAHEDWCRWRAPFWHGSRVMDSHSHHNYHLGFRCCKTIDRKKEETR